MLKNAYFDFCTACKLNLLSQHDYLRVSNICSAGFIVHSNNYINFVYMCVRQPKVKMED